MVFPGMRSKRYCYVDLDLEAQKWSKVMRYSSPANALLDPRVCQQMVDHVHHRHLVDFSFGGWLEDRSFLWRGSYLELEKKFVHLGVDLNVPAGTDVATSVAGEVVRVDDDYPEGHGWGPRVIVRCGFESVYIIYAHLDRNVRCKVGDRLRSRDIFAQVGSPQLNGGWFAHLHVQVMTEEYFFEIANTGLWDTLDGYGTMQDMNLNMHRFINPMRFIQLP